VWVGEAGEVREYDPKTGQLLRSLTANGLNAPNGIAFAPNGDLLVANTGEAGGVYEFKPLTGNLVRVLGTGPSFDMAVTPAGDLLVSGYSGVLRFDWTTGNNLGVFTSTFVDGMTIGPSSVGGCGDGVLRAPEQCDDWNLTGGDGCSSDCQVEAGWTCSGGMGAISVCLAACSDGIDNDGDGLIDYPADPGCASPASLQENPHCSDGIDNDGDGLIDFPADPGCFNAASDNESPQCQDGIDNDGDGTIAFDGGASLNHGVPIAKPDIPCTLGPYRDQERQDACGLGAELAFVLPWIARAANRSRRTS